MWGRDRVAVVEVLTFCQFSSDTAEIWGERREGSFITTVQGYKSRFPMWYLLTPG